MNLSRTASLSETQREEQRKIELFAPGWGRGQIRLVELTSFYTGKIIVNAVSCESWLSQQALIA